MHCYKSIHGYATHLLLVCKPNYQAQYNIVTLWRGRAWYQDARTPSKFWKWIIYGNLFSGMSYYLVEVECSLHFDNQIRCNWWCLVQWVQQLHSVYAEHSTYQDQYQLLVLQRQRWPYLFNYSEIRGKQRERELNSSPPTLNTNHCNISG